MSRFSYKSVPKSGTKPQNGTRARVRETGHVSRPVSRPDSPPARPDLASPADAKDHKARLMVDKRFAGWAAGSQCPAVASDGPRSAQNAPEVPAQLPDQKNAPALDFGPGLETETDPVAAEACKRRALGHADGKNGGKL